MFSINEYCDMYLVFGECRSNARAAARVYAERYPRQKTPFPLRFSAPERKNTCVGVSFSGRKGRCRCVSLICRYRGSSIGTFRTGAFEQCAKFRANGLFILHFVLTTKEFNFQCENNFMCYQICFGEKNIQSNRVAVMI